MPRYDYRCDANEATLKVVHSITTEVATWAELCALAGIEPGSTPADAPVRKVILQAPMANTPIGDAGIKDIGFTKLVKRDDGVYENVTRSGTDKRYVRADDPNSMRDIARKLPD